MGLVEYVQKNETNIDDIVSIIYKRIVKNMSDYDTIDINKNEIKIFSLLVLQGLEKQQPLQRLLLCFRLIMEKMLP